MREWRLPKFEGLRKSFVFKQAETGGVLLMGMGCDQPYRIYFDHLLLEELVGEYADHFERDADKILGQPFTKLIPLSSRPYGRLYAY